jgi:putative ABC transport system permease protein
MSKLLQDIRYARRQLQRNPGFAVVVVVTLALGIGANSAIFTVVEAVLLRSLPYPHPERIVELQDFNPRRAENISIISVPRLQDVRDQNRVFESVAYLFLMNSTLALPGKLPERVQGSGVSGDFWGVMGVRPMLGNTFDATGDTPHSPDYTVLSYGLWQRMFGGDRNIVGQVITLDGRASAVVGVMPREFDYPTGTELWRTSHFPLWQITNRGDASRFMGALARLKPDVTVKAAQNDLDVIAGRLAQQHEQTDSDWVFRITPLHAALVGNIRPALLVLMGAVVLVLLIACANVANLLLSRAAFRQREVAIRQALGAGSWRLVKQFLTESVLLSLAGGCLGLAIIAPLVHMLVSQLPKGLLQPEAIHVNAAVVTFTFGVCMVTGIFLGLAPAFSLVRTNVQTTLKEAEGRTTGRNSHRLRGFMIAAEVGLSLILLIGAGLLMETFWNLQQVRLGFNPDHVLTFEISFPWGSDPVKLRNFYSSVLDRLQAMPGVKAAGTITRLPLVSFSLPRTFWLESESRAAGGGILAEPRSVSGEYFQAMNIPLLGGRFFTANDAQPQAPSVVLISKGFADQFFPQENSVGKRLQFEGGSAEIVGVVGTVRGQGSDLQVAPKAQLYWVDNGGWPNNQFAVRTSVPPETLISAIRGQVHALDPNQAIHSVAAMDSLVDDAVAQPRLNMFLLAVFATLALLLAGVGLYGVISYLVTERTREIGVRMALGAQRRQILGLFVGQGMKWSLAGAGAGLIAAIALGRFLRSLLFEVAPYDPLVFGGVVAFVAIVVLLASYWSARRAARVDPIVALRYE